MGKEDWDRDCVYQRRQGCWFRNKMMVVRNCPDGETRIAIGPRRACKHDDIPQPGGFGNDTWAFDVQALNELFGTLGLEGLAEEARVGVGATVFGK
ncbi:hypothetical protein ACKVWC_010367 [Pyricularia oryzae]|nr:hypothetical protein MCOR04_006460 [Pyricularia oryzae]